MRYRDGTTQRSAGYPTKAEARSVKRAVEHGDHVAHSDQLSTGHASMLFGEYVTTIWWPTWKPAHPRSADGTSGKLTARILPRFGMLPLTQLDAHAIATWQRDLTREDLSPRTIAIATFLSLLGTICNAAIDTGYLDHSPLTPRPPPTTASDPHRHHGRAVPATHDLAHPPTSPAPRRRHRPPTTAPW